jgi:arginine/lysine/ornithine decarboxylase
MLPRGAFFAAKETVTAAHAADRICAEQITPYPPGIPMIIPGERTTTELLDYLRSGVSAGMQLPTRPILRSTRSASSAGTARELRTLLKCLVPEMNEVGSAG